MDTCRKYPPLHASYAPFINLTISEAIFWRNFEDIFSSQVEVWVGRSLAYLHAIIICNWLVLDFHLTKCRDPCDYSILTEFLPQKTK